MEIEEGIRAARLPYYQSSIGLVTPRTGMKTANGYAAANLPTRYFPRKREPTRRF
jgi:hypothetical protein